MEWAKRLSTARREALYDRARGDKEYPDCNICGLPVFPFDRWEESHVPVPKCFGGTATGIAHTRCNQAPCLVRAALSLTSSGQTYNGIVVQFNNAILNVLSGGSVSGTVNRSGTDNILAGGTAVGTTLSGGTENVVSGATVIGAVLAGGTQNIYDGAIVSNTIFAGNGRQNIFLGAVASGGVIASGVQALSGGRKLAWERTMTSEPSKIR
jgi:autotransporter passenger strand-loop-strand repeat protein